MTQYSWTGLGVAEGTALSAGNINTSGNGDTLAFVGVIGAPTRNYERDAMGNGLSITGAATELARTDTPTFSGGVECLAYQFVYKAPSSAPTADHLYLEVGRNANATPASTVNVAHTTGNRIEFRNGPNVLVTGGQTPTLVGSDFYQIDCAVLRNTLTTPSTTNGRIIGRVRSLSAPGTWNSGAEFQLDTAYTVNTTVDKTNLLRMDKTNTASAVGNFWVLNRKWRDTDTPNTTAGWSNAITNFAQLDPPTISTTSTGAWYVIYNVATALYGGALTYSIAQTGGPTHTPVVINPPLHTTPNGVWRVTQPTTGGATTYDVTVVETGGGTSVTTHVVPEVSATTSGQFRSRVQIAGVLV